jgi:hypothetical protein
MWCWGGLDEKVLVEEGYQRDQQKRHPKIDEEVGERSSRLRSLKLLDQVLAVCELLDGPPHIVFRSVSEPANQVANSSRRTDSLAEEFFDFPWLRVLSVTFDVHGARLRRLGALEGIWRCGLEVSDGENIMDSPVRRHFEPVCESADSLGDLKRTGSLQPKLATEVSCYWNVVAVVEAQEDLVTDFEELWRVLSVLGGFHVHGGHGESVGDF